VLLLLTRLGLRALEITRLTLEDLDWREGRLRIRAGKITVNVSCLCLKMLAQR
jgi:integrase